MTGDLLNLASDPPHLAVVMNWLTGLLFPLSQQMLSGNVQNVSACGWNKFALQQLEKTDVVRSEDYNSDVFEELAMPLLSSLYNFAHWQTHNREEAEDLVQETYAKALKGFGSFQPGTNFRAWMFRILRNTFLTSRTGLIRTNTVRLDDENEENILPAVQDTPESLFFQHSTQLQVEKAISELQPHYQEVLLLADVEEMSYLEISETLSIPIGTVMSRLSRARGM